MLFAERFDPYLDAIGASELKRMVRLWGVPSAKLSKVETMAAIRAGLADPQRVAAVLAGLTPFERTALSLLRFMGGELDATALGIALRAAGRTGPSPRHPWQNDAPAGWLQPLADRGLLLALDSYAPHRVSDYDSWSYRSRMVFSDCRLLLPSLRPQPCPLPVAPVAAPAVSVSRRPQSVLLDLISAIQAIDDMGGLRLTEQNSVYAADLKQLGGRLKWTDVLDLDGLRIPKPIHAVVSALRHGGLLTEAHRRLVPGEPVVAFSVRPPSEQVLATLRGFLNAREWWEGSPDDSSWSEYRATDYIRARLALLAALLALPDADETFVALDAFGDALFERVGEWVSIGHKSPRPYSCGRPAGEVQSAEAKWRAELQAGWQAREQRWLESAFRSWLYWLGLVELGSAAGSVTVFRLTDLGRRVLHRTPETEPGRAAVATAPAWVVQPDFGITVYLEQATPRQLAFLERCAERHNAQHHVVQYRLTRESVYRGLESGSTIDELLDGLAAGATRELPGNVVAELRGWTGLCEQVTLHRCLRLLEFANEAERQAAIAAASLEGEPVGDRFLLLNSASGDAPDPMLPVAVQERFDYSRPLPACLTVTITGRVRLAGRHADLLVRAEIAAWAAPAGHDGWQLTAASVGAAVRAGGNVTAFLALLEKRLAKPMPPALGVALRAWGGERLEVELARAVVLRCPQREVLDAISHHPAIKDCSRGRLGPNAVLVDSTRLGELRQALDWVGLTVSKELTAD